jgi:hypothetical protein
MKQYITMNHIRIINPEESVFATHLTSYKYIIGLAEALAKIVIEVDATNAHYQLDWDHYSLLDAELPPTLKLLPIEQGLHRPDIVLYDMLAVITNIRDSENWQSLLCIKWDEQNNRITAQFVKKTERGRMPELNTV